MESNVCLMSEVMIMDKIKIDENYRGISANCVYGEEDTVIDWEFKDDEERFKVFANIGDYIFKDSKLTYDPLPKPEDKTLDDVIKENLNTMIMAALPEGESLTKENAPTLVDIIKPENQGDKPEEGKLGDINNPIEVVGNVNTDGFLYTYGLYYSYGGKKYKCERGGAPDTQGSIKLYYTPDQLIGHYFVTV